MTVLKDILYKVGLLEVSGNMETEVKGIAFDSRKVEKGYLFVAISGTHADGHDFIDEVVKKGAVAIVYEKFLKTHSSEVS